MSTPIPKVVYHGTKTKFTRFSDWGPNFFSADKEYAWGYASSKRNVLRCSLDIRHPFDTHEDHRALQMYNEEFVPYAREMAGDHKDASGDKAWTRYQPLKTGEHIPFITADMVWSFLLERKRSAGCRYDGYVVSEGSGFGLSYVPLSADQITILGHATIKGSVLTSILGRLVKAT